MPLCGIWVGGVLGVNLGAFGVDGAGLCGSAYHTWKGPAITLSVSDEGVCSISVAERGARTSTVALGTALRDVVPVDLASAPSPQETRKGA